MSLTLRAKRLVWRALAPLRGAPAPTLSRYQHWSIGIALSDSPLAIGAGALLGNPALTAADLHGVRARYVADPFLVRDRDGWLLFFEMLNLDHGRGTIGLARSDNGLRWQFVREVLREPFHLSYPCVIEWQGERFMIPETNQAGAVRLYRATHFPDEWVYERDLIQAPYAADATPIYHEGRWYLWVEMGSDFRFDTLRLFHADDLRGPWREHPASPLISGDPLRARPGGRPLIWEGRPVRFAQACEPVYGAALRAFTVTELTPERYAEVEIVPPILAGSGFGWNALGMHHMDAQPLGNGRWIAAVDGCHWGLVLRGS
jgi:hypothetical protein